jgi:hypothetical protein
MSTENQVKQTGSAVVPGIVNGERESMEHVVARSQPQIRISKDRVPAEVDGSPTEVEIFTMALGEEAIFLLPCKTWSQLDAHKWRVQGKLPGTPPGLEITIDRVKVAGESVSTRDPEGCQKLEKAFNEWLSAAQEELEHAKQKTQAPVGSAAVDPTQDEPLRFQVELDKTGQPHIRCYEGKEQVADVACTVPGITSLINQGIMRKPSAWKVGALRDWLELDGELFRFKNGNAGLAELERALNERYHPTVDGDGSQSVNVFANPASETGFDIQFPATDGGLTESRRRHLDPQAIEVLSDPQRCRVLRKGIVVKFTPPTFHFKQKTPDGGERDLESGPENTVVVVGEDGHKRWIDLSHPVSHLGLGAAELAAIFNHPSINRRARRCNEADQGRGLEQAA